MKNKANLFFILFILDTVYILISIVMLFKNFSGWGVANKIVGVILLVGFMLLDYHLMRRYEFYRANTENISEQSKINIPKHSVKNKMIKIKPVYVIIIVVGIFITAIMSNILNSKNSSSEVASMIDGLSNEEYVEVSNILKQCGFTDIKSIKHDELLDNANLDGEKGYRLSGDGLDNVILYIKDDKKVNIVRWASNDLYKDGKIVSKVTDYMISLDEKSKLQYQCQEAVKQTLKTPSKAKFPNISEWLFGRDKDRIIIQSYVDSQNSFGAMIRSDFQVTLSSKDNSIISFIIDGTEYIK